MDATYETRRGHCTFLGPPTTTCLRPECCDAPLHQHNAICNVTLFDIEGPHPASKTLLRCSKCKYVYGCSLYGTKHLDEEKYYSMPRECIEASDVVYISRQLHHLFLSLRYMVVCTTVVQCSGVMGGSSQVFVSNIICLGCSAT